VGTIVDLKAAGVALGGGVAKRSGGIFFFRANRAYKSGSGGWAGTAGWAVNRSFFIQGGKMSVVVALWGKGPRLAGGGPGAGAGNFQGGSKAGGEPSFGQPGVGELWGPRRKRSQLSDTWGRGCSTLGAKPCSGHVGETRGGPSRGSIVLSIWTYPAVGAASVAGKDPHRWPFIGCTEKTKNPPGKPPGRSGRGRGKFCRGTRALAGGARDPRFLSAWQAKTDRRAGPRGPWGPPGTITTQFPQQGPAGASFDAWRVGGPGVDSFFFGRGANHAQNHIFSGLGPEFKIVMSIPIECTRAFSVKFFFDDPSC